MHIINKKKGQTMTDLLIPDKKCCFAGRLDPLAHGSVLILTDDAIKKMDKYLTHDKEYIFEFITGINTNTTDTLGMVEYVDTKMDHDIDNILKTVNEFPREYNQDYHIFSSFVPKKLSMDGKRKPLWWWSTNRIRIDEKCSKNVSIYDLEIYETVQIKPNDMRTIISGNMESMRDTKFIGKEHIFDQWDSFEYFDSYKFRIRIKVSSGFYIRQFVKDISEKCCVPLMVTDIYRTQIFFIDQ